MTELPDAVREALLAAGGCVHEPRPERGCDTCGRPPAAWTQNDQHRAAFDWQALTVQGQVLGKREVGSFVNLPEGQVARVMVSTDDPRVPQIRCGVDPRCGERLSVFTRHAVKIGTAGPGGKISVPIIEIRYPDDRFVRLYIHPSLGPILSTEDLYF